MNSPVDPRTAERLRIRWHPGEQAPFRLGMEYRPVAITGHCPPGEVEPAVYDVDFLAWPVEGHQPPCRWWNTVGDLPPIGGDGCTCDPDDKDEQ